MHRMISELTSTQQMIALGIGLAVLALWIAALIDVMKREFVYPNSKRIWLIFLILLPPLGIILYFVAGRQQRIQSVRDLPRSSGRHTRLDEVLKVLDEKNKKRKLFS